MKKRLKIGFDIDDTLFNTTRLVLKTIGEPVDSFVEWGFVNFPREKRDLAMELLRNEEFMTHIEPISDQVVPFIKDLMQEHDVYFITAATNNIARGRMLKLQEIFGIREKNIIIAGDKSVFQLDIFFDDHPTNLNGQGIYSKVIIDRTWNRDFVNCPAILTVNQMKDVISMIQNGKSNLDIYAKYPPKAFNRDLKVILYNTFATSPIRVNGSEIEVVEANAYHTKELEKEWKDNGFKVLKIFRNIDLTNIQEEKHYLFNQYVQDKVSGQGTQLETNLDLLGVVDLFERMLN